MATALITGGTAGIGASFARALAGTGHDLVLVARDAERLEASAAELKARYPVDVEVLVADLGDRAAQARVAERVADADRPVDVLVNNAGFAVGAGLLDESMDKHDHAAEVMMRSVLLLQGAAGRAMRARGRGTIINVSSTAGFITQGHYSAIKAYVTVLTEGLAIELAGTGVRVCALLPGYVRTEFHGRAGISGSSLPDFAWLDADALVAECLRDVERGRVISIPTARYAVVSGFLKVAPRAVIRRISGRLTSARRSER